VSNTLKVCCIESTFRGGCSCLPTLQVKTMIDDYNATGEVPMFKERMQRVIDSLARICTACLAATSADTWEQLHRNKTCPNKVVP